jgi:hypothetical protein
VSFSKKRKKTFHFQQQCQIKLIVSGKNTREIVCFREYTAYSEKKRTYTISSNTVLGVKLSIFSENAVRNDEFFGDNAVFVKIQLSRGILN